VPVPNHQKDAGTGSNRAWPSPSRTETYRYPNGAPDITLSEPLWAACFLPRRLRSMILARSYSATMPCTWSRKSSSGLWPRGRFKNTTSTLCRRHSSRLEARRRIGLRSSGRDVQAEGILEEKQNVGHKYTYFMHRQDDPGGTGEVANAACNRNPYPDPARSGR